MRQAGFSQASQQAQQAFEAARQRQRQAAQLTGQLGQQGALCDSRQQAREADGCSQSRTTSGIAQSGSSLGLQASGLGAQRRNKRRRQVKTCVHNSAARAQEQAAQLVCLQHSNSRSGQQMGAQQAGKWGFLLNNSVWRNNNGTTTQRAAQAAACWNARHSKPVSWVYCRTTCSTSGTASRCPWVTSGSVRSTFINNSVLKLHCRQHVHSGKRHNKAVFLVFRALKWACQHNNRRLAAAWLPRSAERAAQVKPPPSKWVSLVYRALNKQVNLDYKGVQQLDYKVLNLVVKALRNG